METTRNKITDNEYVFFKELSDYLETRIYFYGSVQRNDYFSGKSDIDIDIFTDNESTTLAKLQQFLSISKSDIKSIVWRANRNNHLIKGSKFVYNGPKDEFRVEISVYNIKYKEDVLYDHKLKTILPFYISFLLIILKILYYNLNLLSYEYFRYCKIWLFTYGIQEPVTEFVILGKKYSN